MSENIPISASASATSLHVPHKRSKHSKYEKTNLPTPPPDPRGDKENDFFEYLDNLQKTSHHSALTRSTSLFAPVMATEDAFDHLEKLYKLMEQMLLLREQNARLHRRVRDLEHLSNLQKMQKQLNDNVIDGDNQDLDKDTAFAETILESILSGTKRDVRQKLQPGQSRFSQSILRRQRNRSCSMAVEKQFESNFRRSSTMTGDKSAKVSKWTKVKAAFKWEKASSTVGDAKSQDSGISGMVPINLEVARYLRVPSTSEDLGHSPADSGAAEISTPGSLSTASSTDDFQRNVLRSRSEDYHSSDEDHLHHCNVEYIPHTKEEQGNSQKVSGKIHRTPWAMMKDIIQTRNSFKRKHRLSAKSDGTMEESIGSDYEDVFENDNKSRILQTTPSPTQQELGVKIYKPQTGNVVPPEIIARYQQVVAEDNSTTKVSKWTRVKKAFLTNHDSTREIIKPDENKKIQAEINRNYRQLQKKLSLEFQEKIKEWEKNKLSSSPNPSPSTSSHVPNDDIKDPAFMKKMEEWQKIKSNPITIKQRPNLQLQSEENLPPEFRKKLQEWKKIKKVTNKEENVNKKKLGDWPKWKSMGGQHETIIEYPQLTEDFIKKLETWKQIKTGSALNEDNESRKSLKENKSSSPRMNRKDSCNKQSKKNKDQHDRELQWFEKELNKIEKEKQRLERERQKFLEREERLTKLRRSVMGGNKKEVLVHTPSGFYRFEGISRKFTQKLYEWEKARGIGPEASTFALLSSCYTPEISTNTNKNITSNMPPLIRSKSADSIVTSALNLTCPLMSHQPSSLSLNDVENLEKECLIDSKASSEEYMEQEDEPEALIVEVEDIIEETAAPLQQYLFNQQLPVYQRQEIKDMCEGEMCLAPKIRRSESTKAQTNYNLIEEIIKTLKIIAENEAEILKIVKHTENYADHQQLNNSNENAIKIHETYCENQKKVTKSLIEKLIRLQEANSTVTSNITSDKSNYTINHVMDTLETIQDLSSDVLQTAEKIDCNIQKCSHFSKNENFDVIDEVNQMRTKILELRRLLSYVCAASDLTAPGSKKLTDQKTKKGVLKKTRLEETKDGSKTTEIVHNMYIKSETSNVTSQGAIKKRIRYRQKGMQCKTVDDSEEDDEESSKNIERKINKHKKLTRTRSVSDNYQNYYNKTNEIDEVVIDPEVVQKVVVPTETNFVKLSEEQKPPDSPVTIFVKTTRKIFTPIIESSIIEPSDDKRKKDPSPEPTKDTQEIQAAPVTHLPPIPASPTAQRRIAKEISPSIRIMMVKYNQKLQEHESVGGRSGGSSGSASPVAWRSPTAERRVKVQTERYQEELNKLSPLLGGRREVQKSASVGVLHSNKKQVTVPQRKLDRCTSQENSRGISKSSSTSVIATKPEENKNVLERKQPSLKLEGEAIPPSLNRSLYNRSIKLQKAKEEFLKMGSISVPSSNMQKTGEDYLNYPVRNRLSQISVGSESSYDSSSYDCLLIKSASAGMINIDVDAYKLLNPEVHRDGYVSLPRTNKKNKEGLLSGKFAFSNIAAKFCKVRMRRGRDGNKMNTISTLCRQSLMVDINSDKSEETASDNERVRKRSTEVAVKSRNVSSEDLSTSSSRTGSWIKRFKPKQ